MDDHDKEIKNAELKFVLGIVSVLWVLLISIFGYMWSQQIVAMNNLNEKAWEHRQRIIVLEQKLDLMIQEHRDAKVGEAAQKSKVQ